MTLLFTVVLSALAAIGVALTVLDINRRWKAKRTSFICVCFREELLSGAKPDMLIICKSDAEQEEILKRVCDAEHERRIFIKRW